MVRYLGMGFSYNSKTGAMTAFMYHSVLKNWESWQQKITKINKIKKTPPILIFFYCTAVIL